MIANVQALRFVAAMLVVWHHVQGPLTGYSGIAIDTNFGQAGVDVFFVISGFIMFHTNADYPRTAGQFWLERLVRIAPLYWLATWLVIAMAWAGVRPLNLNGFSTGNILTSMAVIPDLRADGEPLPILTPGWTLNYEMFFYALFGLTFMVRSQAASLLMLTATFLGLWLASALAPLPFALHTLAQPITLEFAAGAGLAVLMRHVRPPSGARSTVIGYGLLIAGVASLAVIDSLFYRSLYGEGVARALGFGLPAIAIVSGALVLERAGHAWRSNTLMLLGSASYAIYLFHLPVLQVVEKSTFAVLKLDRATAAVVAAAAGLLASAALGLVVHLLVEKPLQAVFKRRMRAWFKPRPATAQPTHIVPAE
jgi:peptidoglycan/LPS O-acetylase OafA/YrhL